MAGDDVVQRAVTIIRTAPNPITAARALYDDGLLVPDGWTVKDLRDVIAKAEAESPDIDTDVEAWRLRGEFIDALAADWAERPSGQGYRTTHIGATASILVDHLDGRTS